MAFIQEEKFIMVDIEEGKIEGFMLATVELFDGDNCAFIQSCFSKKEGNVQVMLNKCIQWANRLGLKKLVFMTKRNPKAWARKYKFNETYTVMQREI